MNEVRKMLLLLSNSGSGQIIVANIYREIQHESRKPTALRILAIWCDRYKAEVAKRVVQIERLGGTREDFEDIVSSDTVFAITAARLDGELDPVWDEICRLEGIETFGPSHWSRASHIKTYEVLREYVFDKVLTDPYNSSPKNIRIEDTKDVSDIEHVLSNMPFRRDCRIAGKKWYWITNTDALSDFLRGRPDAQRLVDALGLAHFCRDFYKTSSAAKFVVEIQFSKCDGRILEPIFAVADNNPRFVSWPSTNADRCGYAVDLEALDERRLLQKGLPERICFTPQGFFRDSVFRLIPHGYIRQDRWGSNLSEPSGTPEIARIMVGNLTWADVVDYITETFQEEE